MSQREIKFRVWYKAESRYLSTPDGLFFEYPSSTGSGEYIGDFIKDTEVYETDQYTGLKDSAGREIYEGDIVEFFSHRADASGDELPMRGVVAYDDQEACFMLYTTRGRGCSEVFYLTYGETVLGNVHQHPELKR